MKTSGLVHLYCGDGKGKTTAAVGLAVRHAGHGGKVVFAQFLKDGSSGECRVLAKLGVTVLAANPAGKFTFRMTDEEKAETVAAWRAGKPNLLIVAPPHIGAGHNDPAMGASCHAASMGVAEEYRKKCAAHGWAFFDAEGVAEFNTVDYMHLSRRGHRQLAAALAPRVRDLT